MGSFFILLYTIPMTTALYRTYRPSKFSEVKGQDHIVDVLKGSIELGRISHSYLFAGGRGTGKTSIARIFAHELDVSDTDIYEIDAASNRGIDDIREIRDGVAVLPFESKYKVYIIDEVHMLTKEAFNALLKTLEEPPAHVIFILATTEIEKLPETVVSRCQTFQFKKPSQAVLKDLVVNVAKKEGFTLEKGAAELVALLGDGSFRDTLSTLQKIVSFSKDTKISIAEVERVTGAPKIESVNNFIAALSTKDIEKGLKILEKIDAPLLFSTLVLERVRYVLLMKVMKDFKPDISDEDIEFLKKIENINSQTLVAVIDAVILTKQIQDNSALELLLFKL